ncbi:MAG: CheW domain-containing protein, partial [Synechocystis sp.]|nr:CheW domain-containing protein [Synechocystis sp.]
MAIDSISPLSYSAATADQSVETTRPPEKFLLFAMGKLNLALPIALVVKILPHTPSYGSGLSDTGILNLEDRSITAIDLHRRLFRVPQPPTGRSRQYFILLKNRKGEEFCLLVNEAPTLMDVPHKQIRKLPESYRQTDSLQCASHVLLIEQK